MQDENGITEKVVTTGVTFIVKELVCIDVPSGKACGALQANCNIYTVPMILQPKDNDQTTLNNLISELRRRLEMAESGRLE